MIIYYERTDAPNVATEKNVRTILHTNEMNDFDQSVFFMRFYFHIDRLCYILCAFKIDNKQYPVAELAKGGSSLLAKMYVLHDLHGTHECMRTKCSRIQNTLDK